MTGPRTPFSRDDEPTLLQERYPLEPWPVLSVTLMLKVTSGEQVRPVADEFIDRFPVPGSFCCRAEVQEVRDLLRPLGLHRQREGELRALAWYLMDEPQPTREQVLDLPGCGRYVADAYSLLVLDEAVEPDDYALKLYVERGDEGSRLNAPPGERCRVRLTEVTRPLTIS